MKFIDDAAVLARKTSGICLLLAGLGLTACSSMKDKPAPVAPVEDGAAPTAEEISSEPDLEKLARERAARGETKAKDTEGKPSAARADTSEGPELDAPADAAQKALAQSLQADYDRALGMVKSGQLDEAYALLDEIQAKAPAFTGPMLNQALIRLKQKKPKDAQALLKKAIETNPKNPYAYNLSGYTEKLLANFKGAREAYEKALELSPKYGKAHFNLAVLADLYLLDLPFALKHYEAYQSLQAQPDPTVAKWIVDLQKRTGVYKPPARKVVEETITEEPAEPAATETAAPADGAAQPAPAADKTEAAPAGVQP